MISAYLEGIGKVDSHFSRSEDDDAGIGPHQELDNVGVGLILFWLGRPQQAGQETVPLMHSVACGIRTETGTYKGHIVTLNIPVYQRGTSITRETRMLRERAQAISMFVLRNLLLYSGTVWTPSSQSW